jgi:hypothetical protein
MRVVPALLAALAAAGCAGVKDQGSAADPEIAAQRATVYFFRKYRFQAIDSNVATRDGVTDQRLDPGTYIVHQARAGELGVLVTTGHNQRAERAFPVAAGGTYYFEVEIHMSDVTVNAVDEPAGRTFVQSVKSRPRAE